VKRGMKSGTLVSLAVLVLIPLLLAATQPARVEAQAAGEGYWQQTATEPVPYEWDDESSYSVDDGSSTQTIVSLGTGDSFRSTATWTSPKASYQGGERVELTLGLKIAAYVWNGKDDGYLHLGLNFVGDYIYARIDVAGMSAGSSTAGRIWLTDASGEYSFGVTTDNGRQVVSSAGGTVTAIFPPGYATGDLMAIYVSTKSGMARYTYAWVAEGDVARTTTAEPPVDSGARFSSISRHVEIFPDANPDEITFANPRSVLKVGDHVVVGENSNAIITFSDLSTLMIKGPAEIVISSGVHQPTALEILSGNLWGNFKKVLSGETSELKANLSTVGIKGTTIVLDVSDDAETLKVLEGEVEFTSLADGAVEKVSGGETASATSGGLSEKTTFDIKAESEQWSAAFEAMKATADGISNTADSGSTKIVWLFVLGAIIFLGLVAIFLLARKLMKVPN